MTRKYNELDGENDRSGSGLKKNYLALDLGAESGRAIVGSIGDGKLSLNEIHRFLNTPVQQSDGIHWDLAHQWQDIQAGIRSSASAYPLESLGVDTWGVDFTLLDENNQPLFAPYHYRDARTDGMMEEVFTKVPKAEIFAQTGIQFMQLNTLYQLYAMVLADHPALSKARTLLTMPDIFNHFLCGSKSCEFSIATTTQCFDPLKGTWAFDLLEKLGIPTQIFPQICQPGTVLGSILPDVSAQFGVDPIPVVAPACHDTGSAVAAVPAGQGDFAWLSSGTWSILGAEVAKPVVNEKALAFNFTNEGGVSGTWRLSKNIMGLWLVQECKREWDMSYSELTNLAAASHPFQAVIDPDDLRFLHPGNMVQKVRQYCKETGQFVPGNPGGIVRIILESLALKYRLVLSQLEELTGLRLDTIHIIGGGTQNRLLSQFAADATGRQVICGPVEATAAGNILMQAIALGHLGSLAEGREMIKRSFRLETFDPVDRSGWDEAYARLMKGR